MSGWDAWNAHVMAVKDVGAGGIFTFEGAVCSQKGFNVTTQEVKAIVSAMTGSSTSSLMIAGTKYMLLRSDPDLNYLQARNVSVPVSIFKTKSLLVVGIGKPGSSAEAISVGVSKVAEMLAANGQ